MHLEQLRILNCFGFADATVNLHPSLIYVLGRNSSGKTALLDSINYLSPARAPRDHPRFANFRPTEDNPTLTATFTITHALPAVRVSGTITQDLRTRGIQEHAIKENAPLQRALQEIDAIYEQLLNDLSVAGALTLTKFSVGSCQLTAADQYKEAKERRAAIDTILRRIFPNQTLTIAGTNYPNIGITSADLDRAASSIIPSITYYNERYNLIADLPDHLTTSSIQKPPNPVTSAFTTLLGAEDLTSLLTTNDPDEQDELRARIQQRADTLAATISRDTKRLIQVTLSPTPSGLQITMRTDGKKSFYRHLSDATKFLFAYHLHADQHRPGAILLFDEPSRGLHASAEHYLRSFLERLATDNHVIVATHSEHLLAIDHLDRIRLMQQDEDGRPVVLNKLRPPRDRANYLLALQPIFEAIGIAHQHHTLTKDRVILTEGLTDYLYLRAFHELTNQAPSYGIVPGRGESTIFTLAPFFASQGVGMKLILDTPDLKTKLQDAYGIPDNALYVLPGSKRTRGIEDLFTTADYQRLLQAAGEEATIDDLKVGNSTYAKRTNKRLVAQTFRSTTYEFGEFEAATRDAVSALLAFCANDAWFSI